MEINQFLKDTSIGISISEHQGLAELGYGNMHVRDALVEISRYILACGGNLIYGGDITYKPEFNFVEALIQLALAYNKQNKGPVERIKNYCAFPIYTKITPEQKRDYDEVAEFIKFTPPKDLNVPEELVNATIKDIALMDQINKIFMAEDVQHNFWWARTMEEMRKQMNKDVFARIAIGGKTVGYKGKYPGIIEEVFYAMMSNKPVYLIGTFGGCSQTIIEALQAKSPEVLTNGFQFKNEKYKSLVPYYNERVEEKDKIDYKSMTEFFHKTGKNDESFGLNNGLSKEDNNRLFNTLDVPEMVALILKGLKTILDKR